MDTGCPSAVACVLKLHYTWMCSQGGNILGPVPGCPQGLTDAFTLFC